MKRSSAPGLAEAKARAEEQPWGDAGFVVECVTSDELGDYLNGKAIVRRLRTAPVPGSAGWFGLVDLTYGLVFRVRPRGAELQGIYQENWSGYGNVEDALGLQRGLGRQAVFAGCYRVVWDCRRSLLLEALEKLAKPMITMHTNELSIHDPLTGGSSSSVGSTG